MLLPTTFSYTPKPMLESLHYPIKCAPCEGREAKICGLMPVVFSYSAASVLAISAALRDSQRVTVEPPNPPPVMRAPMTPPLRPILRAISTMMSSSLQDTSKSSRSESWLAAINGPSVSKSFLASAAAAAMVREISPTTWRERRLIGSPSFCQLLCTSAAVTSRHEALPRIAKPSSVCLRRAA